MISKRTPSDEVMLDLLREAKARGADYLKLSCMADTIDDVRWLALFTANISRRGLSL
jgi:3-dehydroquinate dehydratase